MKRSRILSIVANLLPVLMMSIPGCQGQSAGGGPSSAPASVQVQAVSAEIARAQGDTVATKATVEAMTAANVETKKVEAVGHLDSLAGHLEVAATQATTAEKSAAASEAAGRKQAEEIKTLKAADPVRAWLNLIGIGAIVAGVGVLIASLFVAALSAFPWVRSAAVGAVAFGFALVTIAHFLTQIYWMAGITLLAGIAAGGIYLWTHRSIRLEDAKWVPAPSPPKA